VCFKNALFTFDDDKLMANYRCYLLHKLAKILYDPVSFSVVSCNFKNDDEFEFMTRLGWKF
jgi:hypothetical protein